jgi:signal transduction histidine kinase
MDTPNVGSDVELLPAVRIGKLPGLEIEAGADESWQRTTLGVTEVLEALEKVELLRGLNEAEFRWLAEHGLNRIAADRSVVFRENEPAHHMMILLRGEIYVHRRNSGSVLLTIGRTAQITGKLPYSRMERWGGEGCSSDSLWLLEIHESLFAEMIVAIPSMTQRCVSILLDRSRDFKTADLQAEKLISLGKLAANLSHELKNPASAIRGAALSLNAVTNRAEELCNLGRLFRSDSELQSYLRWSEFVCRGALISSASFAATEGETSLASLDREERIEEWLELHDILRAWEIAPELARGDIQTIHLDEMLTDFEKDTLPHVLSSLSRSVRAMHLTTALSDSARRIFEIITAIQDYAYMDQAQIQEVSLPESLGNALTLLRPRLQQVQVSLDYDPATPLVTGFGAELSQVWTALIENAIYAMNGQGTLTITTKPKGEMAFVEICDNGSGIGDDVVSRIFEPFFTTKPLGQGLGLGLDTVRRIIEKHFGSVSLVPRPGSTCFQVRLPTNRLQIY